MYLFGISPFKPFLCINITMLGENKHVSSIEFNPNDTNDMI